MGIVPAKCTQCGGDINVNSDMDAANCPYCGSAFIVEKAINNYNTTNNVTVNNAVINLNGVNLQVNNNIDFDGFLSRGKNYLKFSQFDDAEKCFMKVLENDSNNEVAKTGMMIKYLFEGCQKFEENSFYFWERVQPSDPVTPSINKEIEQNNSIIYNSVLKARSMVDNTSYIHDFLGSRAATYERIYIKSHLYYSFSILCKYHSIISILYPDYEHTILRGKRIDYYSQFEKSILGFLLEDWDTYTSYKRLIKKDLIKCEGDSVVFFSFINPDQTINLCKEYQVSSKDAFTVPSSISINGILNI